MASGVEGRVVDGVAIDLPDVEVVLHLGNLFWDDAVRRAPYLVVGRGIVVVGELLPVAALDQGYDSSGSLGCASMILAMQRDEQ